MRPGVADESAKVKPTLVGELAVDFEVDLEEDSDLGDALYEYLGLEGDEGAAAEAKGFRLLNDGYTQLLRKLDPQESSVVASTDSESDFPVEWIDLYAAAYLRLGPLLKAGRFHCSAGGAFLRAVAVVSPPRTDILVTRIRRVHLLHSLAALEGRRVSSPPTNEPDKGPSTESILEDSPAPTGSSPRSVVDAGPSITRPTSVSSLVSSDSVAEDPSEGDGEEEVASLSYSVTEYESPRLKWSRSPDQGTKLNEFEKGEEFGGDQGEGSTEEPSRLRGVIPPPVRPYSVRPGKDEDDDMGLSDVIQDGRYGEGETLITTVRDSTPNGSEELETALKKKRKALRLDDPDAGLRIDAQVAQSRSKVITGRPSFFPELRARVSEMQQRMEALRSSPDEASKLAPGTGDLEETIARSLVWDGMDPVEARMVARKVDKKRVGLLGCDTVVNKNAFET
ncbi:hypothetical protein Pmar_PMAR010036 [Perkinsus marinus ATCC 50983]|uniref:Uncharacterized protein n=1 Tax=Perkinsus marinus (strain ATCC 50983 / TXsc) TaxID=423536 RepID=C5K4N0_PERM5|nr:hypothetical protein Pmar_PMAR010036 [Perkinsus marinus ATCC 50983]EER20302.1 hypothetical protein Pmar_PMAR010036 [Perkinsus marinus ATCC 50983]|eukprot:XP_002788506.1 hypothetical protein Pmar_PMAR010036 [Perkinsus marinus ATCC 50983]